MSYFPRCVVTGRITLIQLESKLFVPKNIRITSSQNPKIRQMNKTNQPPIKKETPYGLRPPN
jgi:hypothetical protein